MATIEEGLNKLMELDGALGAAIADSKSGMALGMIGGGVNLEIAAAGNSEVVKAKQKVIEALGLNDKIEDILITLGKHYHLIRIVERVPNIFIYYVLDRKKANLALARHKLTEVESELVF
ncbi:MAG: hypothetical protein N2Z23_09895 [Pyrinomonadaceae bacterium]|nr:hypothetical protein [Pyrinomonadaceae bacterium]MCX7640735.1 hypothetical protein [Pyrinomonadaceae bacterium]MDW8304630.1 hypothetical protein [Acidobacteriota bacterium]